MTTPNSTHKQPPTDALRSIGIFADLREDQLQWFASNTQEHTFAAGDVLLHEGDPADTLYVLLEGEIRGRAESGAKDAPGFVVRSGQVTGLLPFSRMTRILMTARTTAPSWILGLHKDHFQEMIQRIPELLPRLIGVMADRIREYSRA